MKDEQSTMIAAAMAGIMLLAGCTAASDSLEVAPPAAEGSTMALDATQSVIRVPISVSLETLSAFANAAVPGATAGGKPLGNFGPAANNSLNWNLVRAPISVIGADNRLSVSTVIGGTVNVHGSIQPVRGDIGKLLGKLKPSQPYSQTANVGADITASMAPQLGPDWSITPNLAAAATVREASARIAGIFDLSFRGELQGPVTDAVNAAVADLTNRIASDRTLKAKASEAWAMLCEPVPVVLGNGLPGLSLRITPQGFVSSQPTINADGVSLHLGLDALLRLTSSTEPAHPCPVFNENLTIGESGDGTTLVALKADLDYTTLNQALEAARMAQSKLAGAGVEAEIDKYTLSPLGDKLMISVEGTFRETKFFGASSSGTIFLTALPALESAEQRVGFTSVSIDVKSREALGKVAAALATALGPLIETRLEAISFDLKPEIEKARAAANKTAETLKSDDGPIHVRDATLDELRLGGLWHDKSGIHVAIDAKGRITLEAINIAP